MKSVAFVGCSLMELVQPANTLGMTVLSVGQALSHYDLADFASDWEMQPLFSYGSACSDVCWP